MPEVVGVRFKEVGKVYYFDPAGLELKENDCVIVETARGLEFGQVVTESKDISKNEIVQPLKKVSRLATEEDIEKKKDNEYEEKKAFKSCEEKIEKHGLDMKLVDVEFAFDKSKIIFYFTADGRVDFRELVKELASVFRTRIELRQIGVRDEAKMLGGLGPCGRELCCSSFLGEFAPVSIKMAKEQNLSLNPTKISGICSRLMCCLNYEREVYESHLKRLPKIGKMVKTPKGEGKVVGINPLNCVLKVRIRKPDSDIDEVEEFRECEIEKL